jgi:hypothetical protein
VHALCPLNEATVKRPSKDEGLRDLPSILQPGDWMISLDVESAFFHVAIEENTASTFPATWLFPHLSKASSSRYNRADTGFAKTLACHQSHLFEHLHVNSTVTTKW